MKYTLASLLFTASLHLDCTVWLTDGQLSKGEHPENVAVLLGQNFSFSCISGSSQENRSVSAIRYYKYEHKSRRKSEKIYNVFDGQTKLLLNNYMVKSLSNSSGVKLFANAANAAFAGLYACDYINNKSTSYFTRAAELVLLEEEPICSAQPIDSEIDTKLLRCALNFAGAWYPRMEWRSSNGTLMRTCDEQSVLYTDGRLGLRCDVNVTRVGGEGAQCRTFFISDGWRNESHLQSTTYSRHVPSYIHTCSMDRGHDDADGLNAGEKSQDHGLNYPNLLIILAAAVGGVLVVAALVVVVLRLRQRGCGSEKKAIAPDVVAQTSMLDSDIHLARRAAQDNDYAAMPEGRRAAAAVTPPIPSPRPPADQPSDDAANDQIVGADGTIYARLDLAARQASYSQRGVSPPPPLQLPRPAEHSIYAFIDHTLRVNDLPPRARDKRK